MLETAILNDDVDALNKVIVRLREKLRAHESGHDTRCHPPRRSSGCGPAVPSPHVPAPAPGEVGSRSASSSSFKLFASSSTQRGSSIRVFRPCRIGFMTPSVVAEKAASVARGCQTTSSKSLRFLLLNTEEIITLVLGLFKTSPIGRYSTPTRNRSQRILRLIFRIAGIRSWIACSMYLSARF